MQKLIYFIVLNQPRSRGEDPVANLVSLVQNQDILNYTIHFSEEQAFNASKHISTDVLLFCAYVPERAIAYHIDRLVILPADFNAGHIHGYYPNKYSTREYISNLRFNPNHLPQEEIFS